MCSTATPPILPAWPRAKPWHWRAGTTASAAWERPSVIIWRRWTPAIELAKYYEWHDRDYGQARLWAERAYGCLATWAIDWRRQAMEAAIEHRLARLSRKGAIS